LTWTPPNPRPTPFRYPDVKQLLYLKWKKVLGPGEYWRLLTCFSSLGGSPTEFGNLLALYILSSMRGIESSHKARGRGSEFLLCVAAGAAMILSIDYAATHRVGLGAVLAEQLPTIRWSKRNFWYGMLADRQYQKLYHCFYPQTSNTASA
jgi:hypothetical protein